MWHLLRSRHPTLERRGPGRRCPGSIKGLWPDEAVASGWSGPGQLQSRAGAREEGEDFADGGFPGGGFGQREVGLDLVAVAAAIFLLDHVAAAVRSVTMPWALRSVMSRLAAMSRARVVDDAQQHPGVAGQEAPARHP